MQRLTLVGMPGSGKSAVGRLVAARLGWQFIDTDKVIETGRGTLLQLIIDEVGEAEFLRLEERALLDLELPERVVISTGGSVVYSEPAMQRLAANSTVLFIDAPLDAIRVHIAAEAPRGIIGMARAGTLEGLYRQRQPLYRRWAHIVVPCGKESLESEAQKILSKLPADWQNN